MDSSVGLYLLAVLAIGLVTLTVVILSKRASSRVLNTEKYQSRWLAIESRLEQKDKSMNQVVILDADKLVDMALRERGFKGTTMGERMKAAQTVWSNANHIWGAHKVRNRIAHESDIVVSYDIAKRSLIAYKQALKDLGAI